MAPVPRLETSAPLVAAKEMAGNPLQRGTEDQAVVAGELAPQVKAIAVQVETFKPLGAVAQVQQRQYQALNHGAFLPVALVLFQT